MESKQCSRGAMAFKEKSLNEMEEEEEEVLVGSWASIPQEAEIRR